MPRIENIELGDGENRRRHNRRLEQRHGSVLIVAHRNTPGRREEAQEQYTQQWEVNFEKQIEPGIEAVGSGADPCWTI